MNLTLLRTKFFPTHTVGQLYIDDELFCFTLEDVVREVPGKDVKEWKIAGETAIPTGKYKVTLEDSPRFGPETITIHDVPGFSYIRVHSGNSAKDTEGCPIVGFKLTKENIIAFGTTRPAVAELKAKIREGLAKTGNASITVSGIKTGQGQKS